MAGRIGYYGGIVKDGLILDLDAAKLDSYPRTGTFWKDISGSGNNGALVNEPRFDSGNGGSIVFDGTNDYVNCGNSINLQISVASISTWIKRTGDGTRVGEIFIHNQSGISPFGGFEMYIDRTTKKIGMTIRNSNNNAQGIISNSSITTGLWVNIVGVFDGSTVSIYLNGIQDINVISTISSLGSTTQVLGIGAAISDSTYNLKGNIGQTLIYNKALSSQEILQNYNATKGRYDNDDNDTVVIGTQIWTTKNLDVTTYRDGTPISGWAYYGNNPANGEIFGKLYTGDIIKNPKGLAPEGYHIPTDAEWTTLTDYLGGLAVAGGKMKSTGTSLWQWPNTGATNESGFTGLPAGFLQGFNGAFNNQSIRGYFWSSSELETDSTKLWYRYINHDNDDAVRTTASKINGFSVRLIKDI